MRPDSRDLTIDSALCDPMVRAAMRADRIDARDFEALLRSTAVTLAARPPRQAAMPIVRLAYRACRTASTCFA